MSSTYDFAEPGFILIDRVNEMNNNWWCENIRATNPCVPADTWVQTSEGPRQVGELIGKQFHARVDGLDHPSSAEGFFRTAVKPLVSLITTEGFSLRLTADHRVRRISTLTRWRLATEWCAAGDLKSGDKVLLQDHRRGTSWAGGPVRTIGVPTRATSWACWSATARSPRPARSCPCGRVRPSATATSAWADRTPSWPPRSMPHAVATTTPNSPAGTKSAAAASSASALGAITELATRARPAPGPPDDHAGHRARLERVLPRLPARAVRFRGQRAGHAGQGCVDPPRPLRYLDARRRAAHAAAARHRLDHLPQPRAAGPGHHRRERGAFRRAHRLRRHGQALAPGRACWATTSAR